MAKQEKRPTVASELDVHERLIAREESDLGKTDPLALEPPRDRSKEKLIEDNEKSDLVAALKNPAIRRMLYRWVVVKGGLYDADGDPNQIVMAHHVGRRSLALELRNAVCEVNISLWHEAEAEAKSNLRSQEGKPC